MDRSRGLVTGLCVVVLWASAFPAIRVAAPDFGAAGLSLARLLVATVALLGFAWWARPRRPRRADLPLILAAGFFGMTAYQLLLNQAELSVPAGTASLVISAAPLISVAIGASMLGERLSRASLLGSALALTGVVIVCGGADVDGSIGLVIAATLAQGIYHPLAKALLRRYSAVEVATYAMAAGTAMSLPLLPWAWPSMAHAGSQAWLSAAYLGLLPSALGFVLWGSAVRALPVATSTALLYLVPGAAVLIAFLWLGEVPTFADAAGGVVIVCGVVLLTDQGFLRGLTRARSCRARPSVHDTQTGTPVTR